MARKGKASARTIIPAKKVDGFDATLELFFFAYSGLIGGSDEHLARLSLGRVHHRILYFIRSRHLLSVADLTGILGVTRQGLHRPLRQLIDRGYVDWVPDENNRRIHLLHLTQSGMALETKVSGMQKDLLAETFRAAGSVKEKGWREVMSGLADVILARQV
jgi:DNA-binding MarR family transcriptional regulator